MSFFWRYVSFFRYSFIMLIYKCLWEILLWFFWEFCNSISNFVTNQTTSGFCCFFNYLLLELLEVVLSAHVADFLTWSRSFCLCLPLKFLLIIAMFLPIYLAKGKNPQPFTKFVLSLELNSASIMMFYTLINN